MVTGSNFSDQAYQPMIQEKDKFNPQAIYHDKVFSIIFYIQVLVMIILCVVFWVTAKTSSSSSEGTATLDIQIPWNMVGFIAGVTVFLAIVWIVLMLYVTGCIVWSAFLLTPVCCIALSAYLLVSKLGDTTSVVFLIIFAIINLIVLYVVRKRIAFTTVILKISVFICSEYPSNFFLGFYALIFQIIWVFIIGCAYLFVYSKTNDPDNQTLFSVLTVLFILCFYWGSQVIQNVVHTTVCGVVGTWYFFPASNISYPTWKAFKRSVSSAFGAICFGSLIMALVKTIRSMMDKRNAFGRCIMGCCERILKFITAYAFSYVAIYGFGFIDSCKATWDLFTNKGIDMVVNDNMMGTVNFFIGISSGVIMFGSTYFFCEYTGNADYKILYSFVALFVCLIFILVVIECISSASHCLFVCFAEDPARLNQISPKHYEQLTLAWAERYPNVTFFQSSSSTYV